MRFRSVQIQPAALTLLAVLALFLGACASGYQGPQGVAEVYLEAGRHEDAAREAEKELRRYPQNIPLRLIAAEAHAGAGNLDRAIEHLELAVDARPGDPGISIRLGELEQRRGNLSDAYVAFRRASQLGPDEIRAWSGLALSAEALGFELEAETAYARWALLEQQLGLAP